MSAKPIVAASDGSEESLRAVDWAAREAVLRGAPLRIVSAPGLLPRMVGSQGHSEYETVSDVIRDESDHALTAATARAAKVAPDLLIDADHLSGGPAEAVTEAGSGALMLVVGSRGVGAFAALILGSVSRYAATHASSPVVVVREEIGAAHRQVGVGIGGLEGNTAALTFAFEEAALRKASLVAIHAWQTPQGGHLAGRDRARGAGPERPGSRGDQAAGRPARRVAGEVPRRPGQPRRGTRAPGADPVRPVRPGRPGRAGQAPGPPRSRRGHPRGPEPRARPDRHRPVVLTVVPGPLPRQASIDQREKPDRTEPMLAIEPTDSRQASEPAEPMDRIEPAEPIDKMDPLDPMDRIDPLEPMLRIEPDEPAEGEEPLLIPMRPLCRNGKRTVRP